MWSTSSSTKNSTSAWLTRRCPSMYDETARGGDDRVDALPQCVDLGAVRHPAEHHGVANGQAGAQVAKLSPIWLASSRVGASTSARTSVAAGRGWLRRWLQDRQGESGGLAGAGLGDADEVAPRMRAGGMACAWIGVGFE